jgi:hypothetical protein
MEGIVVKKRARGEIKEGRKSRVDVESRRKNFFFLVKINICVLK